MNFHPLYILDARDDHLTSLALRYGLLQEIVERGKYRYALDYAQNVCVCVGAALQFVMLFDIPLIVRVGIKCVYTGEKAVEFLQSVSYTYPVYISIEIQPKMIIDV